MTTLVLIVFAVIALVLTVWLIAVPVEVLAGAFAALRRDRRRQDEIPEHPAPHAGHWWNLHWKH